MTHLNSVPGMNQEISKNITEKDDRKQESAAYLLLVRY